MGRLVAPLICICLFACQNDPGPVAPTQPDIDVSGHGAMVAWFAERGITLPAEPPVRPEPPAQPPAGKAAQDTEKILGDANGNGEANYWDLFLLWQYLSLPFDFLPEHFDFDMLDIDRDGDYDWDDLKYLGEYIYVDGAPNPHRIGEPLTPPIDNTAYNIDLVFVPGHGFSASQMALFEQAAERWESIITDDVSNLDFTTRPVDSRDWDWWDEDVWGRLITDDVVDDLRVLVTTEEQNDEFWGRAGAFWRRGSNGTNPDLPFMGRILISEEVLTSRYERNGVLRAVLIHELGHTIGFTGRVFDDRRLLGNPSEDNPDADTHFKGWRALSVFNVALRGQSYRGRRVPLENGGDDSHWRESVFGNELMSPEASPYSAGRLSDITIRALHDLGYKVNRRQADAYIIPRLVAKPVVSDARPFCQVMEPPPDAWEDW